MKTYILQRQGEDLVQVQYNENNEVPVSIVILKPDLVNTQRHWLFVQLAEKPIKEVCDLIASKGKAELIEVPQDLSFDVFWEAYAYKVGKKERIKRKWDVMPDGERIKALQYIKKYNHYLAERPHIQRKYPETYLNSQEWNN